MNIIRFLISNSPIIIAIIGIIIIIKKCGPRSIEEIELLLQSQSNNIIKAVTQNNVGYKFILITSIENDDHKFFRRLKNIIFAILTLGTFTIEIEYVAQQYMLIFGNEKLIFVPIKFKMLERQILPDYTKTFSVTSEDIKNIAVNKNIFYIEFQNGKNYSFKISKYLFFKQIKLDQVNEDFNMFIKFFSKNTFSKSII